VDTISDRIISAPIGEFCILSGLGRTVVYEMINNGRLESIKIGKRRLILIESYRRLIEQQRALPSLPGKKVGPPGGLTSAVAT
jgi:excisionase family DNA binding protein